MLNTIPAEGKADVKKATAAAKGARAALLERCGLAGGTKK
jgi:hypothetical protein